MAFLSKWDLTVDVVAVGSGLGGLCAAIVAHDAGSKVVVLEKAAKLGGVCAYSGGEVFVPDNYLQAEAGVEDSRELGFKYFDFLAGGFADPKLQAILLDTGPIAAKYFAEKAGVKWKIIKDFPDYHYPKAPGTISGGRYLETEHFDGNELGEWKDKVYLSPYMPNGISHDELFEWGGFTNVMKWDFNVMGKRFAKDVRTFGPGMMAHFVKAAMVDRKIPAYLETPMQELVVEDGTVVGVIAQKDGKPFRIRAKKGVVLAVGGYDWKPEMAKYFEHMPEWNSMCQPSVEGDGMVMGGEAGAAIAAVPPHNLGQFYGYRVPGETHEGKPLFRASWEGGFPHALWVNKKGERFGDEAFYRDHLPKTREWCGTTQSHPNFPPYLIFDQNFREKYPLGTFLPGMDFPEGFVESADSLRELADKLGIDADKLEATVERFNKFAEEGVDHDYDRGTYPWAAMMTGDHSLKNPNMAPLNRGPYFGLRLQVASVGVNAAGLKVDEHARVMHVRGRPIPGLYAAGNSAAPLDIGAGYQSGLSNLRGMVGGFRAGKHISGN